MGQNRFPALLIGLSLLVSCKTGNFSQKTYPLIIAESYQETVYSGFPQHIAASSEPEYPLIIFYYLKNDDSVSMEGIDGGPAEPGLYLAEICIDPEYGFSTAHNVTVEFRITKAPVRIIADDVQSAVYNGDPKRVTAQSEPELPLSYSYYPSFELRQAAIDSRTDGDVQSALSAALRGLTRVERAPIEQGIYYVLAFFPGDDRYEAAYKEIEFTIGPPVRRN